MESCCKDKQSVENRGLRSQDLDSYDGRSSRCPIDLVVLSQIVEDRRLSHFGRTHPQMLSNASHGRHVMRRCSFQTACRHVRETMSMTESVELVSSREKDQSWYSIGLSFPFWKFRIVVCHPKYAGATHVWLPPCLPYNTMSAHSFHVHRSLAHHSKRTSTLSFVTFILR